MKPPRRFSEQAWSSRDGIQREQAIDEARDLVGRELLQHAEVDEHLDDGLARPVVRAAEDAGVEDLERREWPGPAGALALRRGLRLLAAFALLAACGSLADFDLGAAFGFVAAWARACTGSVPFVLPADALRAAGTFANPVSPARPIRVVRQPSRFAGAPSRDRRHRLNAISHHLNGFARIRRSGRVAAPNPDPKNRRSGLIARQSCSIRMR